MRAPAETGFHAAVVARRLAPERRLKRECMNRPEAARILIVDENRAIHDE